MLRSVDFGRQVTSSVVETSSSAFRYKAGPLGGEAGGRASIAADLRYNSDRECTRNYPPKVVNVGQDR